MSTNNIPDSNGLTFEKVWQLFQETSKELRELFKETDRRMQETDRQMQETDRQIKETDRQLKERMLEIIQESDKRQQKNEKWMENLGKQLGDLGHSFGELAEHLVAPGIVRIFNELGYHFHEVSSKIEIKDDNERILTEVDLLLENDETIVAVEVKSNPRDNDIPHHITRLNILRNHIKKHKKTDKKIIGAIAGAIFDQKIKASAIEAGFYTITQSGDTLKMDVPADFKPRIF